MEQTAKNIPFTANNNKKICAKFKEMRIEDCVLNKNVIDIWQFPLHKLGDQAHAILSEDEQQRAARFYFDKHRNRFIAAHAFLRLILSRYLKNINPNSLEFTANTYGKPQLINNTQNLEFNLSHSGNVALLAVGQYYPLGIDLEFFSPRDYLSLANYMFSIKEQQALKNVALPRQPQVFFNIWAQKEAFIKACGMGLSYPTQEFDVSHLSATNDTVFDKKNDTQWSITAFKPTITSCGAICYNPCVNNIRYVILEL